MQPDLFVKDRMRKVAGCVGRKDAGGYPPTMVLMVSSTELTSRLGALAAAESDVPVMQVARSAITTRGFDFPAPPPGNYTMFVFAPGSAPLARSNLHVADSLRYTDLNLDLGSRRSVFLSSKVCVDRALVIYDTIWPDTSWVKLPAGVPLEICERRPGGWPRFIVTLSPDGQWCFRRFPEDLPSGSRVRLEDLREFTLPDSAAALRWLSLESREQTALHAGIVLATAERPSASQSMRLRAFWPYSSVSIRGQASVTGGIADASGEYVAVLPPGPYVFRASARSGDLGEPCGAFLPKGEHIEVSVPDTRSSRPGTRPVFGFVLGADGPVQDAHVWLTFPDSRRPRLLQTDEHGFFKAFVAEDVPPPVMFYARGAGQSFVRRRVEVSSEADDRGLVLRLSGESLDLRLPIEHGCSLLQITAGSATAQCQIELGAESQSLVDMPRDKLTCRLLREDGSAAFEALVEMGDHHSESICPAWQEIE